MKSFLLENDKNKGRNLKAIEIVGLSRSGKTTLLKKILERGEKGFMDWENVSSLTKLFAFLRYLIKNPIKTTRIFSKLNSNRISLNGLKPIDYFRIWKMRNSYISAVLAKYEMMKSKKQEFFIDEFVIQSIFMILQVKSNEKDILETLQLLPRTGKILIVEDTKKNRYERIKKTRFPGEQINRAFAIEWMRNMEFNYGLLKKILIRDYGPIVKNFKI